MLGKDERISLKLCYQKDIRRTSLKFNYFSLTSAVQLLFPPLQGKHFWFSWEDDEGDRISLSSEDEFLEAIQFMKKGGKKAFQFNVISNATESVHHVECNKCGINPIVGNRFKCTVRNDFDLCSKCESKASQPHPMLLIYEPSQTTTGVNEQIKHFLEKTVPDRDKVLDRIHEQLLSSRTNFADIHVDIDATLQGDKSDGSESAVEAVYRDSQFCVSLSPAPLIPLPRTTTTTLCFSAKVLLLQLQPNTKISIIAYHGYCLGAAEDGELLWINDYISPTEIWTIERNEIHREESVVVLRSSYGQFLCYDAQKDSFSAKPFSSTSFDDDFIISIKPDTSGRYGTKCELLSKTGRFMSSPARGTRTESRSNPQASEYFTIIVHDMSKSCHSETMSQGTKVLESEYMANGKQETSAAEKVNNEDFDYQKCNDQCNFDVDDAESEFGWEKITFATEMHMQNETNEVYMDDEKFSQEQEDLSTNPIQSGSTSSTSLNALSSSLSSDISLISSATYSSLSSATFSSSSPSFPLPPSCPHGTASEPSRNCPGLSALLIMGSKKNRSFFSRNRKPP